MLQRYRLRRSYRRQYPATGDKMEIGSEVVIFPVSDWGTADIDALQLGKPCISVSLDLEKGSEPFFVVVQEDLEAVPMPQERA